MNAPTPIPPDLLSGRPALDLSIVAGPNGISRLGARNVSFPWSLGRGYPGGRGEPVMLIPQVAGAGLLAGDDVRQRICVEQDAALHLVSAGAMLTYGAPGDEQCRSNWSIELKSGARAVVASEPYVLFDDADLCLRQSISLAEDATFIGCEGVVRARPDTPCSWNSEATVCRPDGSILFIDRQRAHAETLKRHAKFDGSWRAFGTVLILTPIRERTDQIIELAGNLTIKGVALGACQTRGASGACIRIAASDGQGLRTAMSRMVDMSGHLLKPHRGDVQSSSVAQGSS